MNSRFSVGDLTREIAVIAGQNLPFLIVIGMLQAVIYTASDMVSPTTTIFVGSIVALIFDYAVLQRLLGHWGERWRLGSLFVAQLLSGLGIMLGFVLLVLPGLFLMARWSLVPAFIIVEDNRSQESLSSSWTATADCWLPIAIAYAINAAILGAVLVGLEVGQDYVADFPPLAVSVTPNLFTAVYSIVASLVAVAAFRLSRSEASDLDNVFA
ncbi:hypothetical protein [Novosphingobium guangzhouense]|uniref:Glycerophosphoryl diester phosphodiesterase membrane domain-containing protein n=1 Tax=Novosphingobium guangzhouense TaxID=1850347 RepID=A0A2K2G2Q1_9SPHN|nr:hypothetical protein [Novosphingobium guangzhouense]PNU05307.1 hypothetical protein A8V01_17180 [Novosphingobium guangzhouense]